MRIIVVTAGLLLAACGSDTAEAPKQAAVPATLPAGEYEVTTVVKALSSTDKGPVPTFAKQGESRTTRGCVGADGLPAADLLAPKGDQCELQNPYVRSGRVNLQLSCNRKGQGQVMADVSGRYTADGFTGTMTANSFFAGAGDFKLVEEITARKVADSCTAEGAATKA
jgi:hypothetical protein